MPELKFSERMAAMMLAAADKKVKAKILQRMRKPFQDEIKKNYDDILEMAPTLHFLPFAPKEGKEKDVEKLLKESIKWLKEQEEVYSAFLYEMVEHDGRDTSPPRFLLVMFCEDKDVMRQLLKHSKGNKLQKDLMELCKGKSASEEGEVGINTMLVGVV